MGDQDDKTTEYTYDGSGHVLTVTLRLTGGGQQTTGYVYGSTSGSVYSNDLLTVVKHPDKAGGLPSASEQDSYFYNALGEVTQELIGLIDRNGSAHSYRYDVVGRPTSDIVLALGTNVDGAVRRTDTAYDGQGNASLITSRSGTADSASVVNEVQRTFNGLGQLVTEYQSHADVVVTSSTPKVQYAYTEMSGGNHSRLTGMTYPDTTVISYTYASGLDSTISRLSSLSDGGGTLESYTYLGLGTVVKRAHPQPGVDLTYIGTGPGDAGDQYVGLDRFGRVVDQRWANGSGTDLDRYQYGYDRDGNRLYRDNRVGVGTGLGEVYAYDGLNQLTSFQRGTLNGTKTGISGTVEREQSWNPDATGNFEGVTTVTPSASTTETRTHNKQNQVTFLNGTQELAYDANGNLTTDEQGRTLVWDAWNRLVAVKSGSTTLVAYAYDALGRRISETRVVTTTDLYYSAAGQVLEEKVGSTHMARYVWSPVYVNAPVLRDSGTGLATRLYVAQDANWNVTALLNTSGSVVERYTYDPYGQVEVRNASWTILGTNGISDSAYGWVYDFQGMRHETAADYHATFTRVYSAPLGRFTSNDWIGFQGGDVNLYRFAGNNPANAVDPSGQAWWEWIPIISTIGHALADPKGIRPQDYQQSRSTAAECQVDAEYAFSLCQKRVYAQVSANLASWLGISTGIDFTKGLLGMVMGAVSAWAVKHGIRGAVGGVITGGVLAVDSVVDLAIVFNKAMRIKDAAEAAIQQYCPCQQQRAQAGKDLCTISESLS